MTCVGYSKILENLKNKDTKLHHKQIIGNVYWRMCVTYCIYSVYYSAAQYLCCFICDTRYKYCLFVTPSIYTVYVWHPVSILYICDTQHLYCICVTPSIILYICDTQYLCCIFVTPSIYTVYLWHPVSILYCCIKTSPLVLYGLTKCKSRPNEIKREIAIFDLIYLQFKMLEIMNEMIGFYLQDRIGWINN